jgi:hypothetical protein
MNIQTQEALKMAIEYIDCNCHEKDTKAMVELLTKALEQPMQEPVAVKNANGITLKQGWDDLPDDTLLYTHPYQWQGLTDDEVGDLITPYEYSVHPDLDGLTRAIEQALKEKNGN